MRSIPLYTLSAVLPLFLAACDYNTTAENGSSTEAVQTSAPALVEPYALQLSGAGPILFNSNLEDQTSTCWGSRNSSGYSTQLCGEWTSIGTWGAKLAVGTVHRSGNQAMAFTFTKNEDVAGAGLTLSANVVDVRAYYNFASGFDFGQGIKIGRISSFNTATQLNDIDIVMAVRSSGSVNQCGLTDMSDLGIFFNGRPVGYDWGNITASKSFQRGRWYAIEYQVFLNTPGYKDGWVKLWVDGVQVASKTGINIRGAGGSTVKLNRIRVGGWYSNSANGNTCPNPSQPSTVYVDDVAVGTAYIGTN